MCAQLSIELLRPRCASQWRKMNTGRYEWHVSEADKARLSWVLGGKDFSCASVPLVELSTKLLRTCEAVCRDGDKVNVRTCVYVNPQNTWQVTQGLNGLTVRACYRVGMINAVEVATVCSKEEWLACVWKLGTLTMLELGPLVEIGEMYKKPVDALPEYISGLWKVYKRVLKMVNAGVGVDPPKVAQIAQQI